MIVSFSDAVAGADRRAGRVVLNIAEVRAWTVEHLQKIGWAKLSDLSASGWRGLRSKDKIGLRKIDTEGVFLDLWNDPGPGLVASTGARDAKILALPGRCPETPENRARRLAKENPEITVSELAREAGIRKELAVSILRETREAEK